MAHGTWAMERALLPLKQAVTTSQRREQSERWQVVGVGPHDKIGKVRGSEA
jgi:hypothetical protein